MIREWLVGAATGAMMLFGASSTSDHRPLPPKGEKPHDSAAIKGSVDIACVAAAVAAREQSLSGGMTTFTTDANAAYSARASALASAYAQTGNEAVKKAVRTAWSTFSASLKVARQNWNSAQRTAWSHFKTAAKACRGGEAVSDSGNASADASLGQQ